MLDNILHRLRDRDVDAIRETRIQTEDLPDNQFRAIITSSAEDRHGTRIMPDGVDTTHYRDNPVVLKNHDLDRDIGKVLEMERKGDHIEALFEIKEREQEIIDDLNNGYLNAMSIGFRILERDGDVIEKAELVEVSVVSVPSNPEAQVTQRSPSNLYVLNEREGKVLSNRNRSDMEKAISLIRDVLDRAGRSMSEIETTTRDVEDKLEALEERLDSVEARLDALEEDEKQKEEHEEEPEEEEERSTEGNDVIDELYHEIESRSDEPPQDEEVDISEIQISDLASEII